MGQRSGATAGMSGTVTAADLFRKASQIDCHGRRVHASCGRRMGESPMLDADTTALLRAVLDEVCENVLRYETLARTHVASKILDDPRSRDERRDLGGQSEAGRPEGAFRRADDVAKGVLRRTACAGDRRRLVGGASERERVPHIPEPLLICVPAGLTGETHAVHRVATRSMYRPRLATLAP